MNAKAILAIILVVGGVTLYQASNWWERAYATYRWSETSPDGCIRIDTFEPFWVLPSLFHKMPHPDQAVRYGLGREWDFPVFRRAYEVSTGAFLGETIVYEPSVSDNIMLWNESRTPGRRIVLANGFPLVDSDRCADEGTLGKLEASHERKREANRAMQEASEAEHKRANPPSDSNR